VIYTVLYVLFGTLFVVGVGGYWTVTRSFKDWKAIYLP
jgi:hypothetical protein